MKQHLLACSLLISLVSAAQWTIPPDPPLSISQAANEQNTVRVIPDGSDGWFVLWLDGRVSNTKMEVYGQRIDADGVAAWEVDGRQIAMHPTKGISDVGVALHADGGFVIAYIMGGDTLLAQRFDDAGMPQWAQPALVAGRTNSNFYTIGQPRVVMKEDGAFVAWSPNHQGGNPVVAYNVVGDDGTVEQDFNGTYVPASGFGAMNAVTDGNGGMYLYWSSSNAMGAEIRVQRVNPEGVMAWTGNVEPTTTTPGLGDGGFTGAADGDGGLLLTFHDGSDLLMSRIDTSGALVWEPDVKPGCDHPASQVRPSLVVRDGHAYLAWSDNRPPADNSDLYVQKFDLNGDPLWMEDGVLAIQENTYIPHARIAVTDQGNMFVSHQTSAGFQAMMLNSDGVPAWSAPFTMAPTSYHPFYGDQRMLPTNDGGAVLFWATEGDNIWGTRIDPSSGNSTSVSSIDRKPGVLAWPNPADDRLTIECDDVIRSVEILSTDGRIVMTEAVLADHATLGIGELASGAYVATVYIASGTQMIHFLRR